MAIDSFPNTAHASRAVTLAEHEQLAAPLTGSGLVGYTGVAPVYADSTGRQVKVRAGVHGLIRGTKFVNATETVVAVTTNTSGNPRKDLLVARLDRSTYQVSFVVIAGVAAATPLAPSPVRTDSIDGSGVFDQPLAEITLANAYTTIADLNLVNRAWWLSKSGYQGFDAAKPPIEPGALFKAADAGITYVGGAAKWQPIYRNISATLAAPAGWSALEFEVSRSGDAVSANLRIARSGSAYGPTGSPQFGPVGVDYRPAKTVWAPYHCTLPPHSGHMIVQADGLIIFGGDGVNPINTGANLIANPTWIMPAL